MEEDEQLEQIQQLENIVRQKLTKEALQRYGNIKAAHPEKTLQLLVILGQMIQGEQIDMIDDNKLKEILQHMTQQKKDFNIKRV
jgi:DNA-binding TFAR19-related protein (PDSD5 family)|tara:strand:- start:163 stop:414 length:252 start_codon:yes stop_codon:yes gene_type:complete